MLWLKKWKESLTRVAEYFAEGFHATPAANPNNPISYFPSMHRLFNVMGMVVGFVVPKYFADIAFGCRINGSHYDKVSREEVPAPLRFLHNTLAYNPFSDHPRDRWRKVLHQMIPAVGGAVGAIKGSEAFFTQNGGEGNYASIIGQLQKGATLDEKQKKEAITFAQGKIWRIGAGLSAWVSSASGLTGLLYGPTLNSAFLLCSRSKVWKGAEHLKKWLGGVAETFDFSGTIKSIRGNTPLVPARSHVLPIIGASALAAGGLAVVNGAQAHAQESKQVTPERTFPPISKDMTADAYVKEVLKQRQMENPKGFLDGGVLQFATTIGNMALAVVPKNRLFCSLGLSVAGAGGLFAHNALLGKADKASTFVLLRPLHGLLKVDAADNLANRWKKLGASYTFSAFNLMGVMTGAYFAYKNTRKHNENPQSLEDYVARVGQHHGDKWRWLAGVSGIFGSAAGYFLVPFTPLNYGSSIAMYTSLNQDRMIMAPGLKGLTGTHTTSYLGLREGLDYLCKYAVHNPSRTPAEFEFLALTVLAPLAHAAGGTITAQQIKGFVDRLHAVRDPFWQEGGIPEEHKKAAMKALEAHFKGKGLDKTLYENGLDTTQIDFLKLKGIVGKVGQFLGDKQKIMDEQKAYTAQVTKWREEWQKQPEPASDAIESVPYVTKTAPQPVTARESLKTPRALTPVSLMERALAEPVLAARSA